MFFNGVSVILIFLPLTGAGFCAAGFGVAVPAFCAEIPDMPSIVNAVSNKRLIYLNSAVNLVKYRMKPVNHLPKKGLGIPDLNHTES